VCNKIISSNGYKIVEDKLELNFKDVISYFNATSKGVIRAIINSDTSNVIVLRNNEELEIKDLLVEFVRDTENCIFSKVKYYASVKS
jgi:hypothetical protein